MVFVKKKLVSNQSLNDYLVNVNTRLILRIVLLVLNQFLPWKVTDVFFITAVGCYARHITRFRVFNYFAGS